MINEVKSKETLVVWGKSVVINKTETKPGMMNLSFISNWRENQGPGPKRWEIA